MAIKTGKINMTEDIAIISRITDKDPSVSKSFRSLQGYTAAPDGSQLFAMIKSKNMNDDAKIGENATEVKLVEISYSNTDISSKTYTNLYHANDCTYYQNTYFVVTANNKKIYTFNKNTLEQTGTYEYTGSDISKITCIAHISGSHFLLGQSNKIVVCNRSSSGNFEKVALITLPGDNGASGNNAVLNGTYKNLSRQGMYVGDGLLFRAYSQHNVDPNQSLEIHTNYIAKWELTGNAPKYTGANLKGIYNNTYSKTDILFEIESISGVPNDSMYAAVKIASNRTSDFKAKLYKISF